MDTKKNVENKKSISLLSEKEYILRVGKSGNVGLIANKDTRLYANPRINGTTGIILALLSMITTTRKVFSGSDLESAYRKVRDGEFKAPAWKRLETIYKSLGKSRSPALKLSPVVSALIREIRNGLYKGIDVGETGDEKLRKTFGFNF